MITSLATKSLKATLFFSLYLIVNASVFAAEPTNDQVIPSTEIKSEKSVVGEITLAELGNLAERWFKMEVLVGYHADAKIGINLSKAPLSYGQFLTQLNISGFTAYKANGYIQIIPNREARNVAIPFVEKNKSYLEDEYVTDVLTTEKACAPRVLAVIRPLIPQYGHLSVSEESNALIIVDTYGNVQRIKAVIKALEATLDKKEDCVRIKKNDLAPEKK